MPRCTRGVPRGARRAPTRPWCTYLMRPPLRASRCAVKAPAVTAWCTPLRLRVSLCTHMRCRCRFTGANSSPISSEGKRGFGWFHSCKDSFTQKLCYGIFFFGSFDTAYSNVCVLELLKIISTYTVFFDKSKLTEVKVVKIVVRLHVPL